MFTRILNYLKALFGIKLDQWEDPEVLLKQAQDEMREAHQKNRERAIQAITQKNLLQQQVDDTNKQVQNLQAKAELALKNGNRDLARQLLVEKQTLEATLGTLNESLANANQVSEQIKVAMQREEEAIRTKAAQAMAMKTQWKQAQIENSINQALDKMEAVGGQDEAFQRAQAKINTLTAESSARTEIAKGRLSTQMAELNDAQAHNAADDELSRLEQKLGLASPATASATTGAAASTAASAAEQELAALEQQINSGTSTPKA
ncbi:MAG: PspA/IM30 family protein [Capsulimonadaceae bacterium]|nr:PspA/IM30 family protein [Capsulimonadaceae bacterium]